MTIVSDSESGQPGTPDTVARSSGADDTDDPDSSGQDMRAMERKLTKQVNVGFLARDAVDRNEMPTSQPFPQARQLRKARRRARKARRKARRLLRDLQTVTEQMQMLRELVEKLIFDDGAAPEEQQAGRTPLLERLHLMFTQEIVNGRTRRLVVERRD